MSSNRIDIVPFTKTLSGCALFAQLWVKEASNHVVIFGTSVIISMKLVVITMKKGATLTIVVPCPFQHMSVE
jgi:hypothetical protein